MVRPRLGCLGGLIFIVLFGAAFTALMVPFAFHWGNRSTLMTEWQGVGRLRDSSGQVYGLHLSFFPYLRRMGRGPHVGPVRPWPRYDLRGTAQVCTQQGMRIPFDIRGDIFGAWRDAEGKLIELSLGEQTKDKRKRHFALYGSFQGAQLPMDDHKSMFMYLLPDGKLTPARSYTSPVPEKHATVTLDWGTETDFDRLCRELRP